MKKQLLLLLLTFAALPAAAQPLVPMFKLGSDIAAAAANDQTLMLAFNNGSLVAFSMPSFQVLTRIELTNESVPVGMGFLDDSRLAIIFGNGTALFLDVFTASIIGSDQIWDGEVYRAIVGGRWIILLQKHFYRTQKGFVKLDRLVVYDTDLKAVTFVLDQKEGRLFYAFDVKIIGNLMLLTWIDTTCLICRLDSTLISLYDLSTYRRVFMERFGECEIDIDSQAMVAVRTNDGRGLYYDLVEGRKYTFEVPGRPLDVRVSRGVGYVLSRDPLAGIVSLYGVKGSSVSKLADLPSGENDYAIFTFKGEPAVAASSFILINGLTHRLTMDTTPRTLCVLAEGISWAAIQYGCCALSVIGPVNVTVVTEPDALLSVREVDVTVQADREGRVTLVLPPGEYTVVAWKDGFKQREAGVALTTDSKGVLVNLKLDKEAELSTASKGLLNITVEGVANGVIIEVWDEKGRVVSRSTSRALALELQPGEYQVIARFNECSDRASVRIMQGESSNVTLRLKCHAVSPLPSGDSKVANVSLLHAKLEEYTQFGYRYPSAETFNLPSVVDVDGRVIELSKGVKILVFFYTKCTGCALLVPKLKELSAEVIMISSTVYDDERLLRNYAVEVNASDWVWVLDRGSELATLFNVSVFPTVVLLNNGRVEFVGVGVAGEVFHLAEMLLTNLESVQDALMDPAVIAVITGFALALLGRSSDERDAQEV